MVPKREVFNLCAWIADGFDPVLKLATGDATSVRLSLPHFFGPLLAYGVDRAVLSPATTK